MKKKATKTSTKKASKKETFNLAVPLTKQELKDLKADMTKSLKEMQQHDTGKRVKFSYK
jgi:hypothetical protein